VCPECLSDGAVWAETGTCGVVWSYCVYEHCYDETFREAIPYVVALVELASGPRLTTNIVDVEPAEMFVGMAVEAVFCQTDDPSVGLVRFRPTDPAAGR
jgi:uncharacterized OB-fold protein